MEEGVVGEMLRGPLGEVFDHQQLITGVSGSGNNWLEYSVPTISPACPQPAPSFFSKIYREPGIFFHMSMTCW